MQHVEKNPWGGKHRNYSLKKGGGGLAGQRNAPSDPNHSQSKTWQVVFYILDNILFPI